MISADFLTALKSTTLKKVPENEIKNTFPFESCFDMITLKQSHDNRANNDNEEKHLYLGGLSATRDLEMLHVHNITAVISVTDACIPQYEGIQYYRFAIRDSVDENLLAILEETCSVIDENLKSGSVLVHCNFGVSRSGSVVVAYKGRREQLTLDDALAQLKEDRSCVCPNDGFLKQLRDFLQ